MAVLRFIFAMFFSFLPGVFGILVTPIMSGDNRWYDTLDSSLWTPPGWVFSVVWTVLYFIIGIALFLVMQKQGHISQHKLNTAYILFGINIVLNALWSFVFFGSQSPFVALLVLMTLIVVAIFMARAFFQVSVPAFWLIVPYIFWLMFALYLNGIIVYLN